MSYSLLHRIEVLEATVATLATTVSVDLKINDLADAIGSLLPEIQLIQEQLQVVQLPEDSQYYLEQNELDFFRSGLANINKLVVELEDLRDSLVRLNHRAL